MDLLFSIQKIFLILLRKGQNMSIKNMDCFMNTAAHLKMTSLFSQNSFKSLGLKHSNYV